MSERTGFFPQIAIAIGVLTSNRGGIGRGTRVPLQGAVDVVALLGPITRVTTNFVWCHCSVALYCAVTMASRKNIQKNCFELLADITLFSTLMAQKII